MSVFVLCFFFFRVFCVSFSSFFLFLVLTTYTTTTFTTTKRSNCKFFGGLSLYFKVRNSVFSYVVKSFDTPLFCCVIHELRPKGRGRIKNFLPHKTKQSMSGSRQNKKKKKTIHKIHERKRSRGRKLTKKCGFFAISSFISR